MRCIRQILHFLRLLLAPRADILLENVALRHQLGVLARQRTHTRFNRLDRVIWVCISRIWTGWRSSLVIVKPDTVVRWHRQGWRLYWRWKCRRKTGRPQIDGEVRDLVRRLTRENPLWGAPRIHSELLKLGLVVGETTVA